MKNITSKIALAFVLALPLSIKGDGLGTITGIARTLGSTISGTTTVTPSFCVNSWDYYGKYVDSDPDFEYDRDTVRYDHVLGRYFYTSFTWYYPFDPSSNNNPFSVSTVALQNFYCNGGSSLTTIAQTYTIWITCSVTTTGMAPPSGPYEISFKTVGTQLPASCITSPYTGTTREFRKTYQVQPFGGVVGRVGNPNYSFAYPFQCWAGDPYLF